MLWGLCSVAIAGRGLRIARCQPKHTHGCDGGFRFWLWFRISAALNVNIKGFCNLQVICMNVTKGDPFSGSFKITNSLWFIAIKNKISIIEQPWRRWLLLLPVFPKPRIKPLPAPFLVEFYFAHNFQKRSNESLESYIYWKRNSILKELRFALLNCKDRMICWTIKSPSARMRPKDYSDIQLSPTLILSRTHGGGVCLGHRVPTGEAVRAHHPNHFRYL